MTTAQCRTARRHTQVGGADRCGCTHCQGQCDCDREFCGCGEEIAPSYNNGEWHEKCAACREAGLTDAAYDQLRERNL